jgi:uncharacterized membrane protein
MTSTTEAKTIRQPNAGLAETIHCFEIWPHRSLGTKGTLYVLGAVAAGCAYVIAIAPVAAFWPLVAGSAMTLCAVAIAFACHHRSACWSERIEIDPMLVRVSRSGRHASRYRSVEFNTSWVRLSATDDRYVESRLTLIESGRSHSIGECLSPAERYALRLELEDSLARARCASRT